MKWLSMKMRMPGGAFYERIKYLRRHISEDNKILQAYLEYAEYVYWHGSKNCTSNSYFSGNSDRVVFGDIVIPCLSGSAVGTFWYEFPDLLLPYLWKQSANKEDFSQIDIFMCEGPYEINENVAVSDGDVVIDCGANIGLFSAVAVKRGGHVYAFEPDREIIDVYLSRTAEYNGNIEILPYALSNYTGNAHFAQDHINIGGGNIKEGLSSGTIVPVTTLDEFVAEKGIEKVDFIKADIEGAEREMLQGATRVLKDFAPKLSICTYHLPDDKEVLEKIVLDANPDYHIQHAYKKMYAYVD